MHLLTHTSTVSACSMRASLFRQAIHTHTHTHTHTTHTHTHIHTHTHAHAHAHTQHSYVSFTLASLFYICEHKSLLHMRAQVSFTYASTSLRIHPCLLQDILYIYTYCYVSFTHLRLIYTPTSLLHTLTRAPEGCKHSRSSQRCALHFLQSLHLQSYSLHLQTLQSYSLHMQSLQSCSQSQSQHCSLPAIFFWWFVSFREFFFSERVSTIFLLLLHLRRVADSASKALA
jgi:hypothetical protein